jgi:hypothetical protein
MCVVRVVLLCKGRGADASSFKPNHDESQWWSRRDALVRSVAAFLYGPSSSVREKREIVMIFDEDYCRMDMSTLGADIVVVPTEQAILQLWKEAASNPGISYKGVTCRRDSESTVVSLPTHMDSKRQVLDYLQQQCSMDFLRQHGLNSSTNVILRKTNKKKLMDISRLWNADHTSSTCTTSANKQEKLASIFQELLKPMTSTVNKVVAGILHESSDAELSCFGVESNNDTPNLQLCLFLGAVRDMHLWENRVLETCCSAVRVPLVRVRLGSVSEFTSKILSVVAHHDAHGRLGPAILEHCKHTNQKLKKKDSHEQDDAFTSTPKTQKLHVVCSLPLSSDVLSSELAKRSRALWALVRVVVCTLWRSRLASNSNGTCPLQNTLTIVFEDDVALTLQQDELVSSLALQHQAAPCEYQILEALCKKRDEESVKWNQERANALLETVMDGQHLLPTYALDLQVEYNTSNNLLSTLYSGLRNEATNGQSGQLLALLRIRNDGDSVTHDDQGNKLMREACKQRGIQVVCESIVTLPNIQDEEGATVTMLQHFIYQGRLFAALEKLTSSKLEGCKKKRRRKQDKKAQKEQKKKKKKQ